MNWIGKRVCLLAGLCLALLLCAQCAATKEPQFSAEPSAESAPSAEPAASEENASLPASIPLPEETAEELIQAVLAKFGDALPADADADFLQFVFERFGGEPLRALAAQERYADDLWRTLTGNSLHVLRSLYRKEPEETDFVRLVSLGAPGESKTTVMTFGGDICFADNYVVMQYLKTTENGWKDCIDPAWAEEMRAADVAVLNNEFTISERGAPLANKMYTFRADPAHTALYGELGVDFVTLANNHAFDFGEEAFLDTLQALREYGVDYAGGGRNAEEAQRPFYYLVDGRKIAFISATRAEKYILTPEAGEDSPGVFRCYDPERLLEVIAGAKACSDYVVLLVHWGTEHTDVLESVQKTTSHAYIDAGADLIIGAHAHQLQGIEFYNGRAIFYNLGNFWFDDYDVETGLVKWELDADGGERFYFLPGVQSGCVTSYELGTERGRKVLDHLAGYLPGIRIEDDGRITAG